VSSSNRQLSNAQTKFTPGNKRKAVGVFCPGYLRVCVAPARSPSEPNLTPGFDAQGFSSSIFVFPHVAGAPVGSDAEGSPYRLDFGVVYLPCEARIQVGGGTGMTFTLNVEHSLAIKPPWIEHDHRLTQLLRFTGEIPAPLNVLVPYGAAFVTTPATGFGVLAVTGNVNGVPVTSAVPMTPGVPFYCQQYSDLTFHLGAALIIPATWHYDA
jgi:hypothetical protein